MASVNKVIILGNLGADPEVRYMPNGGAVVNLSIATSSKWKDKQTGEQKEKTEWHRVVMYNRLAEIAGEYLAKGKSVYVEGKLETRKWQDKDGIERYTTEIIGDQMQLIGGREDSAPRQQERKPESRQAQPEQAYSGGGVASLDDEIPFNQLPSTYAI